MSGGSTGRYVLLGVAVLFVAGAVVSLGLGRGRSSPEELAELALGAPSVEARQEAAIALTRHDEAGIDLVRRVFLDSDTAEVRAAVAQYLGYHRDVDSLPGLIDAMEDESPLLRGRAGDAVLEIVGIDAHFDATGPLAQRRKAVAVYRRFWDDAQKPGSKFIEYMRDQAKADASAARLAAEKMEPRP